MKTLKEKKTEIKNISGWYCETTVINDLNPANSIKKTKRYVYLSLTYNNKDWGLLRGLTFNKTNSNLSPDSVFTTTTGDSYQVDLLGGVATHNKDEKIDLLLKNYNINGGDVESSYTASPNHYTAMTWINLSQDTINIKLKTLRKLKKYPTGFVKFDFKIEYQKQYDQRNLLDNNTNDGNDEPTVIDISTIAIQAQVSPEIWIMKADFIIASTEYLAIEKGSTLVTRYNFTNNGQFVNGGTFCTSLNFTNNSTFTNTGAFVLNLSGGNLVFNPSGDRTKIIYNREGGDIINFGTYTGKGTIAGNPVQSFKY